MRPYPSHILLFFFFIVFGCILRQKGTLRHVQVTLTVLKEATHPNRLILCTNDFRSLASSSGLVLVAEDWPVWTTGWKIQTTLFPGSLWAPQTSAPPGSGRSDVAVWPVSSLCI